MIDSKLGLVDTGKSSVVLVISPLVALMVDQVKSLRSRGVKCSILTLEHQDPKLLKPIAARPEIIMPQTFAIILFLNSFEMLPLFPNPLLLFSHYSQQMESTFVILQHQ